MRAKPWGIEKRESGIGSYHSTDYTWNAFPRFSIPDSRFPASLPVPDVGRLAFAAGLAVGAVAVDVDLAVLAVALVLVGLAPRILRHAVEIRALPVRRVGLAGRLGDQRLQALLAARIGEVVQLVEIERGLDAGPSCLARVTRASPGRSITRGTTIAARMPRITTTTRISIRVKPRDARRGMADWERRRMARLVRRRRRPGSYQGHALLLRRPHRTRPRRRAAPVHADARPRNPADAADRARRRRAAVRPRRTPLARRGPLLVDLPARPTATRASSRR